MAEFQNIIRQLNRLCEVNRATNNCANTCPLALLHKKYLDAPSCKDELFVHTKEVEQVVTEWAKENPEPVYPSWGEWLVEQGMAIAEKAKPSGINYKTTTMVKRRIPADIAQKLGIEPKER